MLNIEKALQDKSISKAELADRLGTNRAYVSNLIKKNNPTVETLERVAAAIGVDVVDLFDKKEAAGTEPIYKKTEAGEFVKIGYLEK